jgi:hypothetical protein
VTGQHWGYCDPALHDGEKVEAVWFVQGLERIGDAFKRGWDVWVYAPDGEGGWAACHDHLQHACDDVLKEFTRVSVTERP